MSGNPVNERPSTSSAERAQTIVVYHKNCPDGFGAALAAWLVFGNKAEYWPADYMPGAPLPDVAGRDVYILDFSFDPHELHEMEMQCKSLTLLDHHKSAQQKFQGYRCLCAKLHFDLQRSGARLAWEHFHPNKPVPYLIARIEDRDLWRWAFEDSAEFLQRLDCEPYEFERWADILTSCQEPEALKRWVQEGRVLRMQTQAMIRETLKKAQPCVVQGVPGLMLNGAQHELVSELGHQLAKKSGTYGLVWSVNEPGTLKMSLRSIEPFDVSALVAPLGGGGHPLASACRLPQEKVLDLLNGTL